jgi:hypothetical protein
MPREQSGWYTKSLLSLFFWDVGAHKHKIYVYTIFQWGSYDYADNGMVCSTAECPSRGDNNSIMCQLCLWMSTIHLGNLSNGQILSYMKYILRSVAKYTDLVTHLLTM